MSWELIGEIILAIIALFVGCTFIVKKIKKSNMQKNKQVIRGDNNVQVGGSINIGRGHNNGNAPKN